MGLPASTDDARVGLLGPLSVVLSGAGPVAIASRPQRRLLSLLAVHVGEEVRSASLEEWLELSPGALRTSISRLRRVIGAEALETTPQGYRLHAAVDVSAFERLVVLAPDVGDATARSALEEAIRLWRDEPLTEFADEPWAEPVISRWRELHASAVEDLAVLQLDAGEVSAALVAVRALVDREPLRERAQALLMRALAEGGRPAEALRAFHQYRHLVCEEVGTEPSGALVELDRAIASAIESSASIGPRPGDPAWTRARRSTRAVVHQHGPPVPVSSFVGRRHDLATVLDLVRSHRLVTLTGSGGCGKTRLAIAAAAAEADRNGTDVRWVELGVAPSASDVVEHVSAAVGLSPRPGGDLTRQLIRHVGEGRATLVVLDNAEHVLGSVTGLLSDLLPRCPSLRVLVTSREPLGIAGESVWRVPSLAAPPPQGTVGADDLRAFDAVRLFVERARDARPGFVVDDESLAHVAAICVGVDGLPLAVELAAARTRTLPVEAVAAGISDALRWQATGTHAPLGRHATLHASIAWSVDLIEPLARVVLVRLSVFQGSFTLDAALTVGADGEAPHEVADAVGALVGASLLQFDDVSGRFRMLHTVRRFCTLRANDELERARARHARHLATFCADVGAGRLGIERGQFIAEVPDLVVAMEWARVHEPRLVFAMCAGLAPVRSALGHHGNVADTWAWLVSLDRSAAAASADGWTVEWATAVAAQMASATAHRIDVGVVVDEVDRLLPADAVRARGWLARGAAMGPAYHGRLGPILAHVDDVRRRRDDLEDSIYGGFAAYMLALMGRIDESDRQLDELCRLSRRHHTTLRVDTVGNGYAAAVLVELLRGDLRAATQRATLEVPDDPAFSMTAAAALAEVALVAGDEATFACAVEWSRQRTIPLLGYLPTFIELVRCRLDDGAGEADDGRSDEAADLAEQFWEESAPVPVSRVHPLPLLTTTLVRAGRVVTAQAMTDEAATLVGDMDPAPLLAAGVLFSRATLAVHAGATAEAAGHLDALLAITAGCGFVPMTIDALEQVATIVGDPVRAGRLRTAADRERRRIGAHAPRSVGDPVAVGPPLSFPGAVSAARRWLATVAASHADAQL